MKMSLTIKVNMNLKNGRGLIKMKCECCQKKKVEIKDYRFIEGLFQGKTFMCRDCFGLSDVEVYKLVVN